MASLPDKITCGRCTMSFRVGEPAHVSHCDDGGTHFCAEQGCGLRFWCRANNPHPARVGMYPRDAAQWLGIDP